MTEGRGINRIGKWSANFHVLMRVRFPEVVFFIDCFPLSFFISLFPWFFCFLFVLPLNEWEGRPPPPLLWIYDWAPLYCKEKLRSSFVLNITIYDIYMYMYLFIKHTIFIYMYQSTCNLSFVPSLLFGGDMPNHGPLSLPPSKEKHYTVGAVFLYIVPQSYQRDRHLTDKRSDNNCITTHSHESLGLELM